MNRFGMASVIAGVLASAAAAQEPLTDFDAALDRGRAENKPVFVEFTHPW